MSALAPTPVVNLRIRELPLCAADSTDRRNTLCELLRWRLILQGLARPLIQLARDGAQLCLGMNRQVSTLHDSADFDVFWYDAEPWGDCFERV